MIIQNSTDIKTEYFLDKNGDPSLVDVQYEKHVINPNGLVQLRNIPSIHTVFNITTKNGVEVVKYNKVDEIINQTDFTVDYTNGLLTFHSSQINKEIQVSYTNAIGRLSISSDRIFTKTDNQGNIVQTLNTLIDEGREVLSNLETIGGANKIINELKGYMESVKGLSTTIIEGSNINNTLKRTNETAKTTSSTLNSAVASANNKMQEMTEWVNKNGDVVNLNNRVTTAEGKLNTVGASLEQIDGKLNNVPVNINEYSDLVVDNDWTLSLQKALENNNKIYFPKGTYKLGKILIEKSNVEIYGDSENTLIIPLGSIVFDVQGSLSNEIGITEDIIDFSNEINVDSIDGLSKNDLLLIKSQRDCLSYADCGDNWTLGYGTPNSESAVFGEYIYIDDIISNTIILKDNLMFPFYYKDKTREISVYAREKTTIQKCNYLSNVIIRDFNVIGQCNPVVAFTNCVNCKAIRVKNIIESYNGNMCGTVYFKYCYKCEGTLCEFERKDNVSPIQHHYANVFKVISSELCGFFKCKGDNASQTIDFSYLPDEICTSLAYANECIITKATQSGIISHGGTYKITFDKNIIKNVPQGICNRARGSIITGNTVIGQYLTDTNLKYGIGLYEGYARECAISGNSVSNFLSAFSIVDGGNTREESFTQCNSIIVNNVITNCRHSLMTVKTTAQTSDNLNLIFSDNVFSTTDTSSRAVYLRPYTTGVTINGNIFINNSDTKTEGVWADTNTCDLICNNNKFINFNRGLYFRGVQDESMKGLREVEYQGNSFINCTTDVQMSTTLKRKTVDLVNKLQLRGKLSTEEINNLEPFTIFIDDAGSLSYKQNNGDIRKISFV